MPATWSSVPRKYCSAYCRRRAFQVSRPDREAGYQRRYRSRLKTSGKTRWAKLTASAWVDAQLRRPDGVRQRALRCGFCQGELGWLVDQRALVISGRIVLDLAAADARDRLRVECPSCETFRVVAQAPELVPALAAKALA